VSEALADTELTADERAYMESGGNPASSSDELKNPKPEDKPAEEKAAPDGEGDDEDEGTEPEASDDSTSRKRRVKFETYDRVKKEAAEARRQADEYRQHLAVLQARAEERINALQRQFQQAQPQQPPQNQPQPEALPPPPNRMEDPMGYMEWQDRRMELLEKNLTGIQQGFQQTTEQQQQVERVQHLARVYRTDNAEAARQNADYPAAYNYLLQMRQQEIHTLSGGRATKAQIDAQIEAEELQLAHQATQMGKRPAELIWQMAWTRGFKPAQQAQAAPQAAMPDTSAEQARIEAAARGQERNRSMSNVGRPSTGNTLPSIDKIMSMSDAEFTKWQADNPGALERMQGIN
jgi:hypothetical protein